jgi:SSS family transporter
MIRKKSIDNELKYLYVNCVMNAITHADGIVVAVYAALTAALAWAAARRQKSADDYFTGGHAMNGFAVGLSIFAAAFSAAAFVMLPREGAYRNWSLLSVLLLIPLLITPLLWHVFVPLYMRLRLRSVYEYLSLRFHPRLRRLGALLFFGYAFGWLGSMLYTLVVILDAVVGLSQPQFFLALAGIGAVAILYACSGGLKGIIWLDVLQALTLGGCVVVILLLAIGRVDGGLASIIETGRAHAKFNLADLSAGVKEQTSVWWVLALALFVYLPGYTTSQVTVQRYLSMSGPKELHRALTLNAVVATVVYFLFMLTGTAMFVCYMQKDGALPALASQDQILPHFIVRDLRVPGIAGLLCAGLLAAALSTLEGGINSIASVLTFDLLDRRETSVRANRLLTCLIGTGVIGAALLAPFIGKNFIDQITAVASTFLGLLLGVYVLGMAFRRANTGGAVCGLLAGAAGIAFVLLCPSAPAWWSGAFAFFPTLLVGRLASGFFPPPSPAQRLALFRPPTAPDPQLLLPNS